jgi:protein-tyrosine phosphatase
MKNVILIHGKMRSGKNQFASYVEAELKARGLTVKQDLFAAPLKDGCKEDFKVLSQYLNELADKVKGTELEVLLRVKDENWYEDKTVITRIILQTYGTEIFRKRVNDDWWIMKMAERIKETETKYILVTDTRFKNEISSLSNLLPLDVNIAPIKIERTIDGANTIINEHQSEKDLDDYTEWEYVLENNGTLDDLKETAKQFVEDYIKNHPDTRDVIYAEAEEDIYGT